MSRASKDRHKKNATHSDPLDWPKAHCGCCHSDLGGDDGCSLPPCFGPTNTFDPQHIARAYALGGGKSDEFPYGTDWAFECMFMMQIEHPNEALYIIHLAAEACETGMQRARIGCGHLESLLANHGRAMIGKVEQLARESPAFRDCLGHVWQHGMPDDVWQRVLVASRRQPTVK
jgi:hypothetical protein